MPQRDTSNSSNHFQCTQSLKDLRQEKETQPLPQYSLRTRKIEDYDLEHEFKPNDEYKKELERLEERYNVAPQGQPLRQRSKDSLNRRSDDYQLETKDGPLQKSVRTVRVMEGESPQQYDKLQTLKTYKHGDTINNSGFMNAVHTQIDEEESSKNTT